MNKNDFKLVAVLILLVIILFMIFYKKDTGNKKALVYYENSLILTIDLEQNEKEYKVEGYNGDIIFLAGDGKIKVADEISPLHLCSKQGYISESYETIVCLPNKVIVEIEYEDTLDTVVK